MFFEDGGEFGDGFTFADIEKQEATKSANSLAAIDSKLFFPLQYGNDISTSDTGDILPKKREHYSEGYSANHDGVEDSEILLWQRAFPYMRVEGNGCDILSVPPIEHGGNSDECSINNHTTNSSTSSTHHLDNLFYNKAGSSVSDLSVVGRGVNLPALKLFAPEIGEEVIAQHGILEDVLECNMEGSAAEQKN